jgi:hypothetical protein
LLNTSYGIFTLTGKKSQRTIHAAPRVRAGVLPTTNLIEIPGISNSTTFGQAVFDEIVHYTTCLGEDEMGPVTPTGEIIMPADQIKHLGAGISLSAAAQNQLAQDILRKGWFQIHYLGRDWTLVSDNTIPQDYCHVPTNRPVGDVWLKPSQDADEEEIDKKKRIASRYKQMCYGAAILEPNKKNSLKVRYQN